MEVSRQKWNSDKNILETRQPLPTSNDVQLKLYFC